MSAVADLSSTQLLTLWFGDKDAFGYMSTKIVMAVADLMKPVPETPDTLCVRFYPTLTAEQLALEHPDAHKIILDGFTLWQRRKGMDV
jgi:hypothetical protein